MFADEMFCQPNEPAPERKLRNPVSVKPALTAAFVAWALSLVRLVLAFSRAELSADTMVALVVFCSIPSLGLALWLREQRAQGVARSGSAAHLPLGKDVCATHLRLVHSTRSARRRGPRQDPNGTRAA